MPEETEQTKAPEAPMAPAPDVHPEVKIVLLGFAEIAGEAFIPGKVARVAAAEAARLKAAGLARIATPDDLKIAALSA